MIITVMGRSRDARLGSGLVPTQEDKGEMVPDGVGKQSPKLGGLQTGSVG